MLESVLPRSIDNNLRGKKIAIWLLLVVLIVKTAQGLAVLFGGAFVVSSADGIPLNTYSPQAAQAIVSLWALMGFTRLLICMLCFIVLARYRSILPFMFGLLIIQDLGRLLVFHFLPIVRVGSPVGPTVNFILMVIAIVGLMLSLWPKANRQVQSA
jgi:hypothetical protein